MNPKYTTFMIFLIFFNIAFAARLPVIKGDSNQWGTVLNEYLQAEHTINGTHGNITGENIIVSRNLTVTNVLFVNNETGKVGIGTSTPLSALDVRGGINASGTVNATIFQLVTGGTLLLPNNIITSSMINSLAANKIQSGTLSGNFTVNGSLDVINYLNISSGTLYVDSTNRLIGINTSSPAATLQIDSRNPFGALNVRDNTGSSLLFVNGSSGNVGIGTSTPIMSVDVRGNTNISGFVNASAYYGDGSRLTGLSDGGNGKNGTNYTDIVQSIAVGGGSNSWGNITFINSSTINWTNTGSLINIIVSALFRNESLSNLDARQNADNASIVRTNIFNFITGGINASAIMNTTNLSVMGTQSTPLLIAASRAVGINTTIPNATLEIFSNNPLGALYVRDNTGSSLLFVNGSSGNVGIGIANASQKLSLDRGSFLQTSGGTPQIVGGLDTGSMIDLIYVSGKYAYHSGAYVPANCSSTANFSGCSFRITDISNPSSPTTVGGIDVGTSRVKGIHISGKYAYLAINAPLGPCSSSNLTGCEFLIADITNSTSPIMVGGLDLNTTESVGAEGVYVSGKYAYVVKNNAGITEDVLVVDISNPFKPVIIGGLNVGMFVERLAFSGRYLYIAHDLIGNVSFEVIDVSNPLNVRRLGNVSTENTVFSLYVSGGYAYLGLGGGSKPVCSADNFTGCEFGIVDISDPLNPRKVAGLDVFNNSVADVYVSGKYAYLTGGSGVSANHLYIVDISDSLNPRIVGDLNLGGPATAVFVSGKYAYVGKTNLGIANDFLIVDIPGIDAPSASIGSIATNYISVSENAQVGNSFYADNSINVGPGGIYSQGPLSIFSTGSGNLSALSVRNSKGTSLFSVQDDGLVGINTSLPQALLHINTSSNANPFRITSASSANTFIVDSSGNVGIGTASPSQNLTVIGAGNFTRNLTVSNQLSATNFNISGITLFNESNRAWCIRVTGQGTLQAIEGGCSG